MREAYTKSQQSILRYDNAPHYNIIKTFPHHKHFDDKVLPLDKNQLDDFVNEIKNLLISKKIKSKNLKK
ncbi:MAG: toxin-antitoxin system TumE family protein [Candidatus Helarchaeota archaeon]